MKGQDYSITKTLMCDNCDFPVGKGVKVICGKTLSKTNRWWKVVLLVKIKFGDKESYQTRLYGWQKNKEGIYKLRQKFNVSASKYIGDLINILRVFIEESGKSEYLEKVYESLLSRVNSLEKERKRLEKQRSKIPELKNKIKEFEKMIEDSETNERKIHKFLKRNPWMFGTNYTKLFKSEKPITINSRNDFLLQTFGGYFDILDLKSPKFGLFVNIRGNKRSLSKNLKDSISQVMIYLAEARTYYLTIKDQTGLDLYFPEGIIVIGRRIEKDKSLLKVHNEFLNKINIWTYDDLLDTARKAIKTYQNK